MAHSIKGTNRNTAYHWSHCMVLGLVAVLISLAAVGCDNSEKSTKPETNKKVVKAEETANTAKTEAKVPTGENKTVMVARYCSTPMVIDGKLDEPAWKDAEVYHFYYSKDKSGEPKENGEIRLAWDDNYVYLGVTLEDSDIIATGDKDQLHHYKLGDLTELFLKPANSSHYWELYVTPAGHKTSFWFPVHGQITEDYTCGLEVAATCDGTLNDSGDIDTSWTGEMAMPVKDLTSFGDAFGEGTDWLVFVGRYNYTGGLENPELSMSPALSKTNYHLTDEYAIFELVK